MVKLIRSDLEFILAQIRIAEANAAGTPLIDLLPNVQVPWGLRTVTGIYNNLTLGQGQYGAADNVFPRLLDPVFRAADVKPANLFFPGDPAGTTPTSYLQTHGAVYDAQPRIISNLIVDQTDNNPAAVAARNQNPDGQSISSPGLDGIFGTADDHQVNFMPNEKPDFALTAPFNAWMTFFGQFFDHGLDLVTKGGNGTIFVPLQPDDPLYVPGSPTNFMVETRATMLPGPDGILGTDDDLHENQNTTSPFIDQNQTYTSHPSHQVFLRAYQIVGGAPVATGKLIENRNLGADGKFGTADDAPIGGMATWKVVKAQARDLLGINLTDKDFDNVPLLATDEYGNFIKGAHGMPQVVMKGADGIAGTADDVLVEGNRAAPIDLTNAARTGHQFLIDVNDNAVPVIVGGVLQADADTVAGNTQPRDALGNKLTYDNELLDAHYIAGDGRVNENIGLTAVHSIFHSEHNRLVEQTKGLVQAQLDSGDIAFAQDWVLASVTLTAGHVITDAEWNGERLFATAKFGTEMQYQHLVFEEFARTVQPAVDEFLAPLGYNTLIDPSIVAEFAHTVYRFGHSMLTETVDRYDPNFNIVSDPNTTDPNDQLGLIAAFLNPLAFAASGPTPDQATGAIVRGLTRTTGNEIDEFVTEALRNNLLGTPLDLAVLNIARGRDAGIPSLQSARRTFYHDTGDSNLTPYLSWNDMAQHLRHPESIINFIAAYGKHDSITSATTVAGKREAATLLVLGDGDDTDGVTINGTTYFDRLAFVNATGAWADADNTHTKDLDGVSRTGLGDIDFWIGGLAERQMPFGGLLGSTFMYVFENQLEALQNNDRLYYLARTAGLNFGTELENNTFSQLIMLNTDAKHLPANVFEAVGFTLEVDKTKQFTGLGADGRADPTGGIMINGHEMSPLVIRVNPNDPTDTHYLHYNGYLTDAETVVLGGTEFNDTLIAGDSDDDTVYGDGGNDWLSGGAGDDNIFGGAGDDIIQDPGGTDTIHGDAGNDVIVDGHMFADLEVPNILLGGDGNDFIVTPDDISTIFGGQGDDFILGSKPNLPETGNEGDDWIETGTQDGAPGDNFSPLLLDDVPGNDIFVGGGGFDEMIGEGGDDVFVGSDAQDKMDGMSGFDWVTYKNDTIGVTVDLELAALNEPPVAASPASIMDRFAEVEGLGGSAFADYLRGSESDFNVLATFNAKTSAMQNIALVHGMQGFLDNIFAKELAGLAPLGEGNLAANGHITQFGAGNIILAGSGSDIVLPRGGDDLVDGDSWFNVRISVRANVDGTGPEIASYDSMVPLVPLMLNRTYNPGQLVAVREVLHGAQDFDTIVFQGALAEYTIDFNDRGTADRSDDIITVTDNSAKPRDGVDHLVNVERLQFADQQVDFYPNLDRTPTGALTITNLTANNGTFSTGDIVNVSIAGVHDVDNISATNPTGAVTGAIRYTWQSEAVAGSGVFDDIILLPGGDLAFESASGKNFQLLPLVDGLRIRVKAIYTDAHGVTEEVFSDPTTTVIPIAQPLAPLPPSPSTTDNVGGEGIKLVRSDLDFILKQIKIAEAHATHEVNGVIVAGTPLQDLIPNIRLAYGLRSVDGSENNLLHEPGFDQTQFGAADNTFPRLVDPHYNTAETKPANLFFPGDPAGTTPTSYVQTSGNVYDSQPRTISNLIVDQTANNPAAIAAALHNDDAHLVTSPGLDGKFGTADDVQVYEIPNVKPDFGLTAPFNAWMTFFGQFFDHGLDLVTKGGNGAIFVPLKPDDPLYVAGSPTNFMVETRATISAVHPGADGVLGTADDIHDNENTTTPFVDQNQTYTSHPSHQVFLRAYVLVNGAPVATGKLIENRDLGADGKFGTADDSPIGGMATWKVVKAQARDVLGINLTDKDFDNVPLLATDQYGNFIKGAHGMPQVVMKGADGIAGTADDTLVEGSTSAPVDLTNSVRTGHQFLIDVNDNAVPVIVGGVLQADADSVAGNAQPRDAFGQKLTYDNELLDAHYIAGDGRVNENIGLTAVHSIFHSEHNRLVDQAKETILNSNDVTFLNQWLLTPINHMPTAAEIGNLVWDGERLFQVAKFGTEMQYQHLVFEEFARTVQPMIDPFFAPTQVYDVNLDPSIVAEFAHTVYRFGHSMLTETVDRFDPNFNIVSDPNTTNPDDQLGLIAAFLNPLAFAGSGPTPEEATSAIVRGTTRTIGNEIDEFVTEALRNNLLGTPLDLAVLNLARGRDTGIPSLNAARRDFYGQTGDIWVKPYNSWVDLMQNIKHPESIINFIAAYGVHNALLAADVDTLVEKRAVATALVLGGSAVINAGGVGGAERVFTADEADRNAFLNSTGVYANTAAGVTTTGVDNIDFWIGGLAERQMPFGGLLGSTFNFVFENQLEKLQDGDRFYYLERTSGLSFGNELEFNNFAKIIMANTDAVHLPGNVFQAVGFTLEVDQSKQYTGLGVDGRDDPTGGIAIGTTELSPLVIRVNPTDATDTHYLHYAGVTTAAATVVLGGTEFNDTLIGGDSDDDTIYGDGGNDHLDGGYGDDFIKGGDGDDIIQDRGGSDDIQGGDGNDVIQAGAGTDLINGGFGKDFIFTGEDNSEAFGGAGDDFILGNTSNEQDIGNEGDDWIEHGTSDGAPGDNFDPLGLDPIIGNDIFVGDGENDKFIGEGGDDIMVGSPGMGDRYFGGSGFDWATFKDDPTGVTIDIDGRFFDQPQVPGSDASSLARFDIMEGLSGSSHDDYLRGDDAVDLIGGEVGAAARGSALTNIGLINGLQQLLNALAPGGPNVTAFTTGNILLGGAGSDILEGRGGDDRIDGDAWLNVRISVRANADGTGGEINSFDSMIPLIPFMMNGTYTPGQLVAVREILYAPGGETDTAKFSGNRADYTIAVDGVVVNGASFSVNPNSIITVTDNVGADGTDTLTHIERLQFADGYIVSATNNHQPVGALTFNGPAAEGTPITVSIANVLDADNVSATNPNGHINGMVSYFWQQETQPGIYQDITVFAAGEISRIEGTTFTPAQADVGLNVRVRAVYIDDKGTLEEVFSAPQTVANVDQPAVGAPSITDTTPTEDIAITVSTAGITDPDGLTAATFTFQWQQAASAAGPFTDIAGATGASFTPRAAQVLQVLRVVVTVTDDLGGVTVLNSLPTGQVGDHIIGSNINADTLTGTAFDDWIEGLGGADTLNGGNGSDILDGGANNDTLNGGNGDDVLIGGAGSDTLTGGAGNDSNAGGVGNDIYNIADAGDTVSENLNEGTDTVQATIAAYTLTANVENLLFTGAGNFAGTGNTLANLITGGAGNDVLSGLAGADTLQGRGGDDTILGGDGNDSLTGDGGNDVLNGGAGVDTLNGAGGADTASFAGETDAFFVNIAAATARRGSAVAAVEDTLISIENATGGSGADTLTGDTNANVLDGGAGNDTLTGQAGADTLLGGAGNDVLNAGTGNDIIDGGAGNDTILYAIGDGTDTINGGADLDTLSITDGGGASTLNVGFNGALTSLNGATVTNVEVINVTLGGGNDTLSYAAATVGVNATLGGTASGGLNIVSGVENIIGGNGNDTLTGDANVNTLQGGAGNDTLNGGGGNDQLMGGTGDDTYIINAAGNVIVTEAGGAGADTIQTTRTTFTLGNNVENLTYTGGAAAFTGTGNALNNVITGGSGADNIMGAAGNDTIIGGAGNDALNGGADNDTFVFAPGFGHDTITGFDANPAGGQDLLNIHDMGITAATFAAHATISVLSGNTTITFDTGDSILLLGVNGAGTNVITTSDFIF